MEVQQRLIANAQTASINVTYHGFTPQAEAAFEYAVDIWESLIVSSVTIDLDAYWKPLDPGVLGSCGPNAFFRNFSGGQAGTWYPAALANKLAGQDLDPSSVDLTANFSSTFDWYLGTDGNTPANNFDFVSVVIHELAHGLGLIGSMDYSSGQGSWGYGTGNPFIYDRFTESSAGQSLINSSLFPNPSSSLGNQLTSNNVFFDGTNSLAANNGSRPRLYSLSQWRPGSSYSHLDEDTYGPGTPNSLNTPSLDYAEAIHDPGPIALGIFKDIGWSTAPTLPTIAIAKTTDGREAGPVNSVFTLTRTGSTAEALNVSYTLGGAATRGSDYTGTSPGTATFAAGSATTNITLPTINDTVVDPNETLIATIAAPSGYKISGSASATATIADNDGSGSDFSNPTSIAIPESGASTPYPSTINVSGLSGNLASLEVTLTDLNHTYSDDIDVLLVGPTGAKVILMSDVGGSDGVNNLTLTFDPSATAGLPDAGQITSGTYRPTDFGPGDLFDSPAPAGPYGTAFSVFNNTNPNGTWSLYVIDDGSGDSGTIAGGWSLNIGTNTPVGGTIAIAKTTDGKEAGPVSSVFILTRTGSTAAALNVSYTLTGTATRGSDYTGTSPGTATFAAGATTTTVTLPTINDTVVDPIETIIATIAAPTGYTISGAASASATITDNDIAPVGTIAIAKTTDGKEAGPVSSVFILTRTGSTAAALNVSYTLTGTATRGSDYTGTSPGTATFAAGATTTTVTLPTINDTVVDPIETIIATIAAPTGYTISGAASASATIVDNDIAPVGTIAIAKTTDGREAGPVSSVFTLTRTGSTAAALNVSYTLTGTATRGTDYTGTSPGTATFAAGATTTTVTLPTINDTVVDPNETIIATITAPTGYTISGAASATDTIADNDGSLPIISLTSNYSGVSENGTPNLVYTFNRTGATTQALAVNFTVGGTATQGTDFLASGATLSGSNGIINFATGSAIATLTVNPIADTIKEADDTVDLNLVASTGYQVGTPTPVTTTIINDDGTLNQRGTYGNDFIEAGSALVLSGRSGNDVLIGSRANDILSGGQGADILTGGAGSDLFSFSTPQDGIDRITDFNPVEDLIQISAAGFAGGLTMGEALSLSQFSLGTVTATTRFTFNAATGSLFFDSDGNGGAAPFQIASLNSGLTLTNENIFVS